MTASTRPDASPCAIARGSTTSGSGASHKGKRVLILMADLDVRVIDEDGVMIRHLELDPSVNYQGRSGIIV